MERETFLLEEYKQVRGEIVDRERAITQLFVVAIVASVSILSAVGAIFFKIEPNDIKTLDPAYAYPFLGPLGIVIPILFVLVSHRKDIHRSGSYLQVFFEDNDLGPKWETRLEKYREMEEGESLDHLIITFWAIFVISLVGFIFALYKIVGFNCSFHWLLGVILLLVGCYFMATGQKRFREAAVNVRPKCCAKWKELKN